MPMLAFDDRQAAFSAPGDQDDAEGLEKRVGGDRVARRAHATTRRAMSIARSHRAASRMSWVATTTAAPRASSVSTAWA
jgi:hypothetical protein